MTTALAAAVALGGGHFGAARGHRAPRSPCWSVRRGRSILGGRIGRRRWRWRGGRGDHAKRGPRRAVAGI